jgi:sugar phosphate permease
MASILAPAVAVLLGRRKVYYGWWLLAASVAAMALGSGVSFWAFGFYVQPLEREFGWSRAEVSLGFSASLLMGGLSGPFVGRWIDVRGPRSAILIGTVLTALSYLLLATTNTLWQWYVYSAINAVVRQLMFFIPFMALISRWFDRRRGIAVSILGTGFSLGGFIVVPVVGIAIETLGWREALVASGAAVTALFLPIGIWVVRNTPGERGLAPDGTQRAETAVSGTRGLEGITLRQALHTPLFWALSTAFMLFFYGMFGWLVHQVPFYESIGISRRDAATIVSVTAGLSVFTRLLVGVIADRIPRFEVAALGLALTLLAAMVTLSVSTSAPAIGLFLVLWVIGTSGGPMIEALVLTRSFGVAHFATILGAVVVVETIGQILSPTLAGAIYDATGSYDAALLMFIATFTCAFFAFLVALRLPRPWLSSRTPAEEATATH